MNGPLVIQSVLEGRRAKLITAQKLFIGADSLVQWNMQSIILLFVWTLQLMTVT